MQQPTSLKDADDKIIELNKYVLRQMANTKNPNQDTILQFLELQKQSQQFFLDTHKYEFRMSGQENQNFIQSDLSLFSSTAADCLSMDVKIPNNQDDYKLVGLGGKELLHFRYFKQKNLNPKSADFQITITNRTQDSCQITRNLDISTVKFSFQHNILYFGSLTGEIGLYKYTFDNEREVIEVKDENKYTYSNQFQEKITQIQIYYRKEPKRDYLLISSYEGKIILFEFEERTNQNNNPIDKVLQKKQELNGHNEAVFWLTLSDTKIDQPQPRVFLASSGKDPNILIWKLEKNKWIIYTKYLKTQFGNRISFFDQGEIVWQLFRQPIVRVMKMDQKKIVQLQQLKINDYSDTDYNQETDQFPLIYNEKRNIIVLKNKDKIYIIKKSLGQQGVVQLIQTQIKCGFNCNMAAVSQDGNVLYTLWDKKYIHRYKLNLYD